MGIEDRLLYKIAKHYYEDELNIQEIAKLLKMSIATVSRYLKKARDKKIVEIKINPYKENHDEIEEAIEKKYNLREVYIVSTISGQDEMYAEAATIVSEILERLVKNNDFVGVSWGETDKKVFDSITVKKNLGINVVPIIGGMGAIETGVFTNAIAKTVADKFHGKSYIINSPAVLDSESIKRTIEKDSNTIRVLQLWEKLKVILVGVGTLDEKSSICKYNILSKQELAYLRDMGVVGEVNINYLDKDGRHVPNDLDKRLIRLSLEQLERIENVILFTFGTKKAEGTKAVLRSQVADIFITDADNAKLLV
jgi:DNA-binding transcriptional regulator LsrR (DeoR family)